METPMTLPETIRSQLHLSIVGPLHDGMWVIHRRDNLRWNGSKFGTADEKPKRYRSYDAARKAADSIPVVVEHAGGTFTITPEQARKVLAGGELVVQMGKVVK